MKKRVFREQILHMWPAKILSLAAAIILYFLTAMFSLETDSISVPINYRLPRGYSIATEHPIRARLVIRASKDQMQDIKDEHFSVSADFSEKDSDGVFKANLVLQTQNNPDRLNRGLDISVDPLEVKIELEKTATRDIPVLPILDGKPKPGFELGEYASMPSEVTVTGPERRVRALNVVETEAVSLEGRSDSFNQQVRLRVTDPLVRVPNTEIVDLRIGIRPSKQLVLVNDAGIYVLGLSAGLRIVGELPKGQIRFQADQSKNPTDANHIIRLLADGSGIHEPGMHTLVLFPELPNGSVIVDFQPSTITLNVEKSP